MPPKNATANGTTRRGPQFKPPRPVKAPAPAAAAKASAAASRATGASKKPGAPAARSGLQPAATIISSDEEDAQEDEFDDMLSDDLIEDAPPPKSTRSVESLPAAHPIPAPLLARLLHENFEDTNTQIQKGAMTLTGRYMEIFVREALARAKHERGKSARNDGISDGFLQVEDLEKLAPQLVLDF
ncbi:hypothetical protein E8E12_007507 [Didymella heteroderae]|uniref:Centromere protein X n=1 Tax=Didymella heteroderae TaxID=1769908 RepID=A0A9P5C0K0_9PLEO|nr:hypothetical protein E8E12_007507 [Didymella heteroderae]